MSTVTIAKQKKCGLIMPISAIDGYPASHWKEVALVIQQALSDTDFSVVLVSDSDEIGVIQKRIVQNIYDNEIVICDVSAKNPNVMFELGMRLAFDKPAIIIKDDATNYSFDTAPIEHLDYPRDLRYLSIQTFKTKLRDKVVATYEASKRPDYTTFLKHFGNFVVADIEEKKVSKCDYLLEAISELRKDVLALGQTVRSGNPRAGFYGVNVDPIRAENKLIAFIKSELESKKIAIDAASLDALQNVESELFKDMFKTLLKSTYAPTDAGDTDHMKKSLMSAAGRFKYLCESNFWSALPTSL